MSKQPTPEQLARIAGFHVDHGPIRDADTFAEHCVIAWGVPMDEARAIYLAEWDAANGLGDPR
jgi:hypothetical protein